MVKLILEYTFLVIFQLLKFSQIMPLPRYFELMSMSERSELELWIFMMNFGYYTFYFY